MEEKKKVSVRNDSVKKFTFEKLKKNEGWGVRFFYIVSIDFLNC